MRLSCLLALLSLVLLANGTGTTNKMTVNLPGGGSENPTAIQDNIDRIQNEIKDLNVKVANLLAALNETNAVPFMRIDKLTADIEAQKKALDEVSDKVNGLSSQVDKNDATIKNYTNYVNCFKASQCGPEKF